MRRVAVIVGIALAVCLALGLPTAQAQETAWVRGTVAAIAGDTITVKVGTQDMTFNVDKSTRVIARGAGTAEKQAEQKGAEGVKIGALLKVGEGVEVHYKDMGTTKMASEIRGGISNATMAQGHEGKNVRGKVTAVANDKLTVNADGKDYEFTVDSKTRPVGTGLGTKTAELKKMGKTPTFTDFIAVGDTVLVSAGPDMKATEVRIVTKATK
jgi:preprotein translocase subunit YajC